MVPKTQHNFKYFLYTIEFMVIALSLLATPMIAQAGGIGDSSLPDFSNFVENMQDGKDGVLKGVYVSDVMAFPIVQQPVGNPGFVSQDADAVTQFSMAAEVGNIGLLAHNHLAGQTFTNLSVGDEVRLVYGDGKVESYIVTEMLQYQALQPYNPYSEFRDLETSQTITAETLFRKVYRGDKHVTFQVCIANDGVDAWGRLFVIAQPKPAPFVEKNFVRRLAYYLMLR